MRDTTDNAPTGERPGRRQDEFRSDAPESDQGDLVAGDVAFRQQQLDRALGLRQALGRHVGVAFLLEGVGELAFSFGGVGDVAGSHGLAAGLGDGLEGLALVLHVAFGGLDEVGDQVVPSLELDVDL